MPYNKFLHSDTYCGERFCVCRCAPFFTKALSAVCAGEQGVKHRGTMDTYLTLGAIVVEFGLPAALIYVAAKKPNARKIVAPVVGALTPLLLVYVVGGVSHILRQEGEPSIFMAVFVMSFFPYCVLAVAGAALGIFLPKNLRLQWRYLAALFLGPAVGLGLVAVS